MLVRSRMTANVLTVTPTTTLGEALRITREQGIRHLPVVDNGKLVGLLSDRDLRLAAPPAWASDTDYAELRATWRQGQKWETLTERATVWVPVSDGGYREPTWDANQEYRQADGIDATTGYLHVNVEKTP